MHSSHAFGIGGAPASKIILGPICLKYWGAQTLLLLYSKPNIGGAWAPRPIVRLHHCLHIYVDG